MPLIAWCLDGRRPGCRQAVMLYVVVGREGNCGGGWQQKGRLFAFQHPQQLVSLCVFTGREKEIDLFVSCLKAYKAFGQSHILAFEGTMGSGKSHLLAELASLGQAAGHRYRFLTCSFGTLPLPIP